MTDIITFISGAIVGGALTAAAYALIVDHLLDRSDRTTVQHHDRRPRTD